MTPPASSATSPLLNYETAKILADLRANPESTLMYKRRTGKTTALILRALELVSEGHEVDFVSPSDTTQSIAELLLQGMVGTSELGTELRSHIHFVRKPQGQERKILVDEPQLIRDTRMFDGFTVTGAVGSYPTFN